ncbi:MAG: DUF6323 family protein [Eubacteriales bacterium]|jgi:hypothetical protein|nr:DUF6323 family protein [Eubacteriales bacterium]
MHTLININDFYALQSSKNEELASEVMVLNDISVEYGLTLTKYQAAELVDTRNNALRESNRLETELGAVKKIIERFCSSSYLSKDNYGETLNELLELFYHYKTELRDRISDIELIDIMYDLFESKFHGSIDLMEDGIFQLSNKLNNELYTEDSSDDVEQDMSNDDDNYIWDDYNDEE